MKTLFLRLKYLTGILILCGGALEQAQAQGQGQRNVNQGQNRNAGSSSSSSGSLRQYYNNGTVGDATVSVDPETRRVIVITDEETSQYVSQVITNLDRPKPQVLIKVVFLEVTHNNSSDIGVEGGYRPQIGAQTGAFSNLFGLTPGLPGGALPVPPGGGLYQMMGSDYQVTLRMLAQAGKLEILSRPSVLARNNQPATITVGKSVPLITSTRYDTFGNAINAVSYQSVGIILRVTPFITSDNLVEMIVSPEISTLASQDESVPTAPGVSSPVINIRSADTVVVTPDSQTVVIGGLMQNVVTEVVNKVPFFGDLPWLGGAFRRTIKANTKTELIIFLTPQIVPAPGQLVAVSARERAIMEFQTNSFSSQELNRFLDGLPVKGYDASPVPYSTGGKKSKKKP